MTSPPTSRLRSEAPEHREIAAASRFGLIPLRTGSPLAVELLPTGAVFALRHGPTLINQLLPGPAENGLFRLLLRWRNAQTNSSGWASLVGSSGERGPSDFVSSGSSAAWFRETAAGIFCETRIELHPTLPAWTWRIIVRNNSKAKLSIDLLHAQDLGLADEAAVRNNEAYTSQYIDLLPLRDETLGWTIFARQNLSMAHSQYPWLAFACGNGAAAFCTDGSQFFGADHRITNEPAAIRLSALPSRRLQSEFALAGLQSHPADVRPDETAEIIFSARFVDDHPAASSVADLALLRELFPKRGDGAPPAPKSHPPRADDPATRSHHPAPAETPAPHCRPASVFVTAPWIHGDAPSAADWDAWFPGSRRHEERAPDGGLLAFFYGADTHVVSREKEAAIARPHGHILRSGDARWFDADHFGLTCYAAGIFSVQAYLGHPSFARLLSVARNPLNVTRGAGQRAFVRRGNEWCQLGVPSAFAMTPGEVRWIYRFGDVVITAHVCCAKEIAAAHFDLRVIAGPPCEFLITHELVLGALEFEHGGKIEIHSDTGWIGCRPDPQSLVGRHQPGVCFAIAAAEANQFTSIAGDGLLYSGAAPTAESRSELPCGPYATLRSAPTERCGVILAGTHDGPDALSELVAAARAAFSEKNHGPIAAPPAPPLRLRDGADRGVARIDEILPWFAHNAAIHFSAPHGLEQYGGAAWGVRDVCQGSIEWLLAAGEFRIARQILETVFAQQYASDGGWPQWFMFPPYRFIQQPHSHGDVCFWPVKALGDYVEASNDLEFLDTRIGYTDPQHFEAVGPGETILAHCERVIAQAEARFIPGTALVNYGDGDWDDTLQPADPGLRTRMVSPWTVGLAFHSFRQLGELCRRAGKPTQAQRLDEVCLRIRRDFAGELMPGGVVAGFMIFERATAVNDRAAAPATRATSARPLIHPDDTVTHIRYRLLPMTRSILAELFTPSEARRHLDLIAGELVYPDGVRLMSEPSTYNGGVERLFKRAETAANVGREIGLQYVHAHLRYAEALAKVGDAEAFWMALQVVNPVSLTAVVPHAAPRQSNVYFSSSDADFANRYEASARWPELRTGGIAVRGGWRLYSSGPGLFLHKIRACLLGVRESFGDVVFDPVMPRSLDGLRANIMLCDRPVELRYRVHKACFAPRAVTVNGTACSCERRERNPYRAGGVMLSQQELRSRLAENGNVIEIDL